MVQAYAYGKFIGHLDVTFDDEGSVTGYSGNPVPMWDIAQDAEALKEMETFYEKVGQKWNEKLDKVKLTTVWLINKTGHVTFEG